MRKHALTRIFALAMALLLLCVTPALAATCTLCGTETGSADYVCTNCLLDLLHKERDIVPMEVTSAVLNEDGTVTVTWVDEADNGPYSVFYELLESAPVPFGWTAEVGLNGTSATLTRLVPGVSYIITVQDSKGQFASIAYYAPVPGTENAIGAKLNYRGAKHANGRIINTLDNFSASEIALDNGIEHGLYLRLNYSTLAKTRHYTFQVAVTAPNEFTDVILCGTLELPHGKSELPAWNIPVDEYFDLLQNYYGSIPAGDYTVTLYFNGQVVHAVTFPIAE